MIVLSAYTRPRPTNITAREYINIPGLLFSFTFPMPEMRMWRTYSKYLEIEPLFTEALRKIPFNIYDENY